MSLENVEVVRRALTALDRRDVEAYLEVVSPQIELISFASPLQGQGPITGHEGIRDYFHEHRGHPGIAAGNRDLHDSVAELQADISEFREVGDREALEATGLSG